MSKILWKPGNFIYPIPAVLVSCGNFDTKENLNVITIAWTGTINTNPPMVYISIRPSRYSYNIIKNTKEFVINLTTESLVKQTDFAGVRSGKDIDKAKHLNLTYTKSFKINAPSIKQSPVNIECAVKDIIDLGSHSMFIAEVVAIGVDEKYLDKNNKFDFEKSNPICYSHGGYYGLTKKLGGFGFSITKTKLKKTKKY